MNSPEYIVNAKRTESPNFELMPISVLHGAIGMATEAGELLDVIKKGAFYKRGLDVQNIKEEIGDSFWYTALICDHFGWTFEEIMAENIAKLRKRYPEQFTEEDEKNRDYEAEQKAVDASKKPKCPHGGVFGEDCDNEDKPLFKPTDPQELREEKYRCPVQNGRIGHDLDNYKFCYVCCLRDRCKALNDQLGAEIPEQKLDPNKGVKCLECLDRGACLMSQTNLCKKADYRKKDQE